MIDEAVRKSSTLIEALPYIKAFAGKFVVIKLGGSAQSDPESLRGLFTDIDFMLTVGIRPLVVYGGGKRISEAMAARGLTPTFIQGQRVTPPDAMDLVSQVLIDTVGRELLEILHNCGGQGELLNGRDHGFLRAVKKTLPDHPESDLGCVGDPVDIEDTRLARILERRAIPLIAPVACSADGTDPTLYNVNGDNASALIARELEAEKLVFLSDIPGIYEKKGDHTSLCPHLTESQIRRLIRDGVIDGGMIPKVEACCHALDGGVRKAHIVPGAQAHALLLEIFTERGVGTEIVL